MKKHYKKLLLAVTLLMVAYFGIRQYVIVEGYCWNTLKKYSEEELLEQYLNGSKHMPSVAQSALKNFPNCCKLEERPLILRESDIEVMLNALFRGKYFYGVTIYGTDAESGNQPYYGRSDISSCGDMLDLDPSYNKISNEQLEFSILQHKKHWETAHDRD